MHGKFSAKLLLPEQRDRAGADSTVSLMELIAKLKGIHGQHYSANHSVSVMRANFIQSSPANESRERLTNECPPMHLIHLFRSYPLSDNKKISSARNGLQITDNVLDSLKGQIKLFRQNFDATRQSLMYSLDMMDCRLKSLEEIVESNLRLVSVMSNTLLPEENETSKRQESLLVDCEDVDHME